MGLWGTIVWTVAVLCAIWVIFDVIAVQKKMKKEHRIVWIICAVLPGLNIITAIIYYFLVKTR